MRGGLALTAAACLAASPVCAATNITLLYTPGSSFTESYVAKDQGIFEKHGLDVTLTIGQNGSVITAALIAGSAQIGAPTPRVFLQAHEQGVDLVILASANRNPVQPPVSETGNLDSHAVPQSLAFWIATTREQGLIKNTPDAATLIAP